MEITASFLAAGLAGVYIGFLTVAPGANPMSLGWKNLFVVASLASLLAQVTISRHGVEAAGRRRRSEGEIQAEAVLGACVQLLKQTHDDIIYRAVITIVDADGATRTTVCGVNTLADPDLRLRVPVDFGVSGQAFLTRAMRAEDVTSSTRSTGPGGTPVPGVWPDLACVLSYPLLNAEEEAFGTVNFDSDKTLKASGLGNRALQESLGQIVDVIAFLMRDHGINVARARRGPAPWQRASPPSATMTTDR